MPESPAVGMRRELVEAVEADLIGPFYPEGTPAAEEVLPLPPSRWYWTGFIAPQTARDTRDPTAEEEIASGTEDDEEDGSTGGEPEPKQLKRFPASIGLSVLLPPARERDVVRAVVTFAEYLPEQDEASSGARPKTLWRRAARGPLVVELPVEAKALRTGVMLPDTVGVWVEGEVREAEAPGLEPGTRALSLFVVNRRMAEERGREDAAFLFQVRMQLEYAPGLVARPNHQGEHAEDEDDRVADLQFRHRKEWAVGHGVAVDVEPPVQAGSAVTRVRTTFVPRAEVRMVEARELASVTTDMRVLSQLKSGQEVIRALMPLCEEYALWVRAQAQTPVQGTRRVETRDGLCRNALRASERMRRGIERLAGDAELLAAFTLANEAMAEAAVHRSPERYPEGAGPKWRLFQLAFLLLNIEGLVDEGSADRAQVELIFFPTGGGKTEAYLGVIALTLLLRRMRGQAREDKGLGVAVLLRYTLRLLTLDQLGRAATLVCALEQLRVRDPARLGSHRFAVGLWVGRSATANTLDQVRKAILDYKNSTARNPASPCPLTSCPWCRQVLGREALTLVPSKTKSEAVVIGCTNKDCEFSARRNREGLPVLFVDEQIYRELPAFVVATVDKFAMMPWRGETGMLFGRARFECEGRFFGPLDAAPKGGRPLPEGLRPPELIVQDELHLISGPLGTMVGLYESAIEYLCTRQVDGRAVGPKVLASTATVRRAREQIRALFGRSRMALFPPPGVDDSETWFARVATDKPGRLYIGIAGQGRSLKGALLRTYVALLAAGQKLYDPKQGASQPADAYMTLAGYFNSLRELGGMRRLVEDDVRTRCMQVEQKVPLGHQGPHPWLRRREIQVEPVELTSRENTGRIKEAKERLGTPFAHEQHVDVLLASNMISVGVDIDRLGLMVVAGQPKTTSEYIQASSRVGRQHPGLVVTCFNIAKPRDRSHYERFATYHESFYRFVEAMSLTPFSGPALDRGLAGALVAMTRLDDMAMTRPEDAMALTLQRAGAERAVRYLAERAGAHDDVGPEYERRVAQVRARGEALLDSWENVIRVARHEAAARRAYSRFDKNKTAGKPLLYMAIDEPRPDADSDDGKFVAGTSMRDVEETVHLWLERGKLGGSR